MQYIQFSKRVTRWGIGLVTAIFILCIALIAIKDFPQYVIAAINSLYTAYVTIMGITIGAYQGNSSLQKWTKAKYDYDKFTEVQPYYVKLFSDGPVYELECKSKLHPELIMTGWIFISWSPLIKP